MRAGFDEADSDFLCARRIWSREQTKNGGNVSFLSTTDSKFGSRGTESRQKLEEMCDFCLPAGRNSVRAASKVEQNHPKLKKYSTRFHRRNARLVTNVANQTQKQLRHGRRQYQNFHCDRKPASRNDSADKPRSVAGICPHPGCKHVPIESSSRLLWHAHYLMFSH